MGLPWVHNTPFASRLRGAHLLNMPFIRRPEGISRDHLVRMTSFLALARST